LIYYILDPGVAPLKSMLWDFFCAKIQFIMAVISTSQFKRGIYIIFQNEPHMIMDTSFVSPGKGSAFYRTKLKNLYTGRIIEYTYKSGEKVEEVLVETHEAEYYYFDGSNYVFIEPRTFEQYMVPVEIVGEDRVYLKEGLLYRIKFYEETPVGISLPKTIAYTVVEAEKSVKGDTATNATKLAVLDTGLKVQVPLFIKTGEEILVSTETGAYLSRK